MACVGQVSSTLQAEQSAPVLTACLCEYTFLSSLHFFYALPLAVVTLLTTSTTSSFSSTPCFSPSLVSSSSSPCNPVLALHPSWVLPVFPHCHAYVSEPQTCPSVSVSNSSSVSFFLLLCHTTNHHHPSSVPHPSLALSSLFSPTFVSVFPHIFQMKRSIQSAHGNHSSSFSCITSSLSVH